MIPIYFSGGFGVFSNVVDPSLPTGYLTDATTCTVEEEINGQFELYMEYPETGIFGDQLSIGDVIFAIPSPFREVEPFYIYKVYTKQGSGLLQIYARHASYRLAGIPVKPFVGSGGPAGSLTALVNAVIQTGVYLPFEYSQDLTSDQSMTITTFTNVRDAVCGPNNSFVQTYGCEVEWSKFGFSLVQKRGSQIPKEIPNLGTLTGNADLSDMASYVVAYWQSDEANSAFAVVPVGDISISEYNYSMLLDCSDAFEQEPTSEQLTSYANTYISNNPSLADYKLETSVEVLAKAQESQTKFDLGDVLTNGIKELSKYGNAQYRVIRIMTDVLGEKYTDIGLETREENIVNTIVSQENKMDQYEEEKLDLKVGTLSATNIYNGGLSVPLIQCGKVSQQITANEAAQIEITFPEEFPGVPVVVVTPLHNSNVSSLACKLMTVSATGCVVYLLSSTGGNHVIEWQAMYSGGGSS